MAPNVRVIVVGGGPVGLTAAHILSQAGIDFIVLEARETCLAEEGASLNLYPGTLRVLHQLGLGDAAEAISYPVEKAIFVNWNGQLYKRGNPGPIFSDIHGCRPRSFHRLDVLRLLFDGLKPVERERVLTNKKLVDIESTPECVRAYCEDGSIYEGTFVLGVDGAHSKTRDLMRQMTLKTSPEAPVNAEKPFTAHYRVMYGTIPHPPGMGIGENHDCHGAKYSTMLITGCQERAWFFLYEYLDEPTNERYRYTENDMKRMAEKCRDMHVSEKHTFGDIWPTRYKAGMTDLHEGILDHWSGDRIVLAGDAAMKVTPNIGWGYFAGVQNVIGLTNLIRTRVDEETFDGFTSEELSRLFKSNQDSRQKEMRHVMSISASATRQSAWPATWGGLFYRFMEWVSMVPGFEYFTIKYIASPVQTNALVLEFLSCEEPYRGLLPWAHSTKRLL